MKVIDIRPSKTQFLLVHPITKEHIEIEDGSKVCWEVVGPDSQEYADAQKMLLKDLEEIEDVTTEDYKALAKKQLSHLVVGWDEKFNDSMGGPFSQKYVLELLENPNYGWMYEQLDAFVGSRKNFFLN